MLDVNEARRSHSGNATPLLFFAPYVVPITVVAGYLTGELRLFKVVVWLWLVVAVLDLVVGPLRQGAESRPFSAPVGRRLWRLAIVLWVPAQAMMLACGLLITSWESLTLRDFVLVSVSVGVAGGMFGVPVAHELMHRAGRFDRALAQIVMTSLTYPHFCIEHVHGHHRRVATLDDPATAQLGESFYAFYPRAVIGGLLDAWNLERSRLRRAGRRTWSPGNRMLRYAAILIGLYGIVGHAFGALGVAFLTTQSVVAFSLIELFNYVQHYGLMRREEAQRRYAPVMPWHSWESTHAVSNLMLFNLGRHSDHHCHARRPYQELRSSDEAPQLPMGYFCMYLLPLCPFLWRRVMDTRVRAWREQHNIPQNTRALGRRRRSPFPWGP